VLWVLYAIAPPYPHRKVRRTAPCQALSRPAFFAPLVQGSCPVHMDNAFRAHQGERLERLERSLQRELMPRLVHARRQTASSPQHDDVPFRRPPALDVDAFVAAVRGHDDQRAAEHVRLLIDSGVPIDTVYLDLLAPAARRLGAMWEADECDFVEVTVSLGRMQRLLRDLSQRFLCRRQSGRAGGQHPADLRSRRAAHPWYHHGR